MHPFIDLKVPDGTVAIHWFEQSSFALKGAGDTIVLVDPYSPHDRPSRFLHPEPPIDEAAWRADVVLLTHNHGDHTHTATLERLQRHSPQARYIGPAHSVVALGHETDIPAAQCAVVTAGETETHADVEVSAVFSKPPFGDPVAGIPPADTEHLGFVVDLGDVRVYVSGDPIYNFADNDALTSAVADLAPHIGLLTCHPSEGEFPFFDGCARLASKVGLAVAVPAHYECFRDRNYAPAAWQEALANNDGPATHVIARQGHALFDANGPTA